MTNWVFPPVGEVKITEHFSWAEAVCRHCGMIPSVEAVKRTAEFLEAIRKSLGGRPIHVNSWCRCEAHNKAIGGAKESYHVKGEAADITSRDLTPGEMHGALLPLQDAGLVGGLGNGKSFTHVDRGPKRRWSG